VKLGPVVAIVFRNNGGARMRLSTERKILLCHLENYQEALPQAASSVSIDTRQVSEEDNIDLC
jgi:hypothetical protein